MKIKSDVLEKIISLYPIVPPENGGVLGGINGVICEYYHDGFNDITDAAMYVPNVKLLNNVIDEWNKIGVEFVGLIHSHISDNESLSGGDKEYIREVFKVMPDTINMLFFPVMLPKYKTIIPYIAKRESGNIRFIKDEIHVVKD